MCENYEEDPKLLQYRYDIQEYEKQMEKQMEALKKKLEEQVEEQYRTENQLYKDRVELIRQKTRMEREACERARLKALRLVKVLQQFCEVFTPKATDDVIQQVPSKPQIKPEPEKPPSKVESLPKPSSKPSRPIISNPEFEGPWHEDEMQR